jgi:hypothetical protein
MNIIIFAQEVFNIWKLAVFVALATLPMPKKSGPTSGTEYGFGDVFGLDCLGCFWTTSRDNERSGQTGIKLPNMPFRCLNAYRGLRFT